MLSNIMRRPIAAESWLLQRIFNPRHKRGLHKRCLHMLLCLQEFREQVSSQALFSLPCRQRQLGCLQITSRTQRLRTSAFKDRFPNTTGFQIDTEPDGHAPTRATSCGGHEVPCHPSDPFKIKMVAQPPLAASSNLGSQEIVLHAITSVAPDAAALAMHPSRMDRNNMATISFLNAELPWMRRNLLQHEATNVWTYGVEGMAPDCAEQGRALSSRLTA